MYHKYSARITTSGRNQYAVVGNSLNFNASRALRGKPNDLPEASLTPITSHNRVPLNMVVKWKRVNFEVCLWGWRAPLNREGQRPSTARDLVESLSTRGNRTAKGHPGHVTKQCVEVQIGRDDVDITPLFGKFLIKAARGRYCPDG